MVKAVVVVVVWGLVVAVVGVATVGLVVECVGGRAIAGMVLGNCSTWGELKPTYGQQSTYIHT